jgi:hypothetical protein
VPPSWSLHRVMASLWSPARAQVTPPRVLHGREPWALSGRRQGTHGRHRAGSCPNPKPRPSSTESGVRGGLFFGYTYVTAGLAKGPAWQCAAPSCSCGGPFSVFSTDLGAPGQGASARLGPQAAIVRLRRRLAYWQSRIASVWWVGARDGIAALDYWNRKAKRT